MRIARLPLVTACLAVAALAMTWTASIPAAPATADAPGARPAPLTPDDVVLRESIGQVAVAPGGALVAWVRTTADLDANEFRRALFVRRLADTAAVRLTEKGRSPAAPAFSPDGARLAWLDHEKKEKPQIHLSDLRGGLARVLTSVPSGVSFFAWRSPGEIVFAAREDSTLRELRLAKKKEDAVVVADQEHMPPVRLFSLDVASKQVRRLTTNEGQVTELAVSPDGQLAAVSVRTSVDWQYDHRIPPDQYIVALDTGEMTPIFTEPHVDPGGFAWTRGGDLVARRAIASDTTDTYVSVTGLVSLDPRNGSWRWIEAAGDPGIASAVRPMKTGLLLARAGGVRAPLALLSPKGRGWRLRDLEVPGGREARVLGAEPRGELVVYESADASTVPVVMTARLRGTRLRDAAVLLEPNERQRKKALAEREIVRWRGALGDIVEGILYKPIGRAADGPAPLVVSIHGGPAGADLDFWSERWSNYPHLLAGRGMAVLKVNYHGSGNYGLRWVESIKGRYYELEVPDIVAGVDTLVARGIAHPDSLALAGWSNGSILSIMTAIEDDRFKAVLAGAGDVNWTSDYGNCAFGAGFDNAYFGGPPWELPEIYLEKSPLFRMDETTAPTLIMFGAKDTNVPTSQGWEHFRALQQIGKAPVRFILFPGSPHGLRSPVQQKRKIEEELAWLDQHLFGRPAPGDKLLCGKSPLGLALRRAGAARSGDLFGRDEEGTLVPETVPLAGLHVGRFEVTRAQLAASRGDAAPPGEGNLPAAGVAFEEAKGYCRWLSEQTGRRFRLPTVAEAGRLAAAAKGNLARENNLERWLDRTPTPDELPALRRKIAALEKTRLLIEPVGSFGPIPESWVYDLGGNVFEWAVGEDGDGALTGLAAISSRDPRVPERERDPRYAGFRVIEER